MGREDVGKGFTFNVGICRFVFEYGRWGRELLIAGDDVTAEGNKLSIGSRKVSKETSMHS